MLKPAHGAGRTSPMSSMTSGPEPRYKYGKPTEKAQLGKPPELGYDIANYGLPAIDVQTQRRNFPGYTEANYYSLDDMQRGDTSGHTETDSTAPEENLGPRGQDGYTRINKKSGPTSKWNSRRS